MGFWRAAAAGDSVFKNCDALLRILRTTLLSSTVKAGSPWDFPGLKSSPPNLTRGAANQMRASFALSALQSQRSMSDRLPRRTHRRGAGPNCERGSLFRWYTSLALAVRQSHVLQPVWECPPPYRRLFHIRRFGFTLNATGLGRPDAQLGRLRRAGPIYLTATGLLCQPAPTRPEKTSPTGKCRQFPITLRPSVLTTSSAWQSGFESGVIGGNASRYPFQDDRRITTGALRSSSPAGLSR